MPLQLTIRSPGGESFSVSVDEAQVRIGRAPACDIRLPYPVVSGHHLTLRRDAQAWWLQDAGSTNGTFVDGVRIAPGEPIAIYDGMRVEILDVRIECQLAQTANHGFTLEQSGTLLRKMLAETTADAVDDHAFFEVIEGAKPGDRGYVPDDLTDGSVGDGVDDTVKIAGIGAHAFSIGRDGDGFRIRPKAQEVSVRDSPVGPAGHLLRSGDHLIIGATRLAWFDPLEPLLAALDEEDEDVHGADAPVVPPEPEQVPTPEPEARRPARLTPLEIALLIGSLIVMVGAIAALMMILSA